MFPAASFPLTQTLNTMNKLTANKTGRNKRISKQINVLIEVFITKKSNKVK